MGIFNRLAEETGLPLRAESRGIAAYPAPATENAVHAAKAYGADISGHVARQVDESAIRLADRVYGMTRGHVRALASAYPQYKDKIFPLSDEDIPDPIGGSFEQYEETARRINVELEKLIDSLTEAG
jgi:protein-tyrosine-phosphatase